MAAGLAEYIDEEPRGGVDDRFDAAQLHAKRERTAVKAIGRQRTNRRTDLAQTGGGFGFQQRVLSGERERSRLALEALRLRQRQCARERRAFNRLFGEHLEQI